ncbi:MAG: hypothetical protein J2P57_05355, partial [Acidimicrobiaceae bacterium]|nr:hypothetical protein [Acidimicrobiaceae bacterium]
QVIFLALVLWAAAVPNADEVTQLEYAYSTGQLTTSNWFMSSMGNGVDKYSECAGLSVDLGSAGFADRVRNVLWDREVSGCGALQRLVLGHSTQAGTTPRTTAPLPVGRQPTEPYPEFRYWNGYTVLERPLVAWFGLATARVVVAALMIGSLIFLAATVGKAAGWVGGAALIVPLLFTTDLPDLPQSLNHAISMSALLVGAAGVAAVVMKKGPRPVWLAGAAMLSGALYSYLDVLLTPPLALGLTVAAAALSAYQFPPTDRRSSQLAFISFVAGAAWVAGWALTWATKWLVSAVLFGPSFVSQMVGGEVTRRLDGAENGTVDLKFGAATRLNLVAWLSSPIHIYIILACTGLAILFMLVGVARYRWAGLREMALLFAPGLLPFAWFEALRNHSEIHSTFTYRSLALTLGLAMAATACVALRGHVAKLASACQRSSRLSQEADPTVRPAPSRLRA